MRMQFLSSALAALLAASLCLAQDTVPSATRENSADNTPKVPFTKDSLATVKQKLAKKEAVLLDVRSEEEWQASHLKVAEFIPTAVIVQDDPDREKALKRIDKSKIVYVHCRVGGRACHCAEILAELGYNVRPLKVDYEKFAEAGFEEVKSKVKPGAELP